MPLMLEHQESQNEHFPLTLHIYPASPAGHGITSQIMGHQPLGALGALGAGWRNLGGGCIRTRGSIFEKFSPRIRAVRLDARVRASSDRPLTELLEC
jgi:hypothetical protein